MKPIILICAMVAMMFSAVAWANKPETALIDIPIVGFEAADCGDFRVLIDFDITGTERTFFNGDGSYRVFSKLDFLNSIYYNEFDSSKWLPGTNEHVQQWLYFENDELVEFDTMGPEYKVIVPGYGAVLLSVGHFTFTWNADAETWEVSFVAGPSVYADDDAFDAICALLGP